MPTDNGIQFAELPKTAMDPPLAGGSTASTKGDDAADHAAGHLEERGAARPAMRQPSRERLVLKLTRLTNQLRAVLLERDVILPKRRAPLSKRLDE